MTLTAISLLLPLLTGVFQVTRAAELSTLFTTVQERQVIDSNRYKSDDGATRRSVRSEAVPKKVQEEVTRAYRISGITVSSDGPHTVWINSLAYEDGAQLEDKSRIKVLTGGDIRVRITTPDGKQYYATSGELLEVSYRAPIGN